MKKILALVLAALMVFAAVSALADNSKGGGDIPSGTVEAEEEITLEKIADTAETQKLKDDIKAGHDAGDDLAGFPEEIRAKIPEGRKTVYEMDTYTMKGYEGKSQKAIFVFKFDTPFEKDTKVSILLGICPAGADVEWLVLEGTANAEGNVEVEVTKAELDKISSNPFVAVAVAE